MMSTVSLHVFDAKNLNKRLSPYYAKYSIKQFFEGKKSYYEKLLKKKIFIESNQREIINYFKADPSANWTVKEAFISNNLILADHFKKYTVEFILQEELEEYLLK